MPAIPKRKWAYVSSNSRYTGFDHFHLPLLIYAPVPNAYHAGDAGDTIQSICNTFECLFT